MATNMHKKYTESKTRQWAVASGTQAGVLVINAESGEVGVTLTARGDSTATRTIGGVTISGLPNGGIGNDDGGAVVATDGTWRFAVAGVANGDTGAGGAGTNEGTEVYRIASNGNLTLTASGNTLVGVIDDGVIVNGVAPVKIGVIFP